MAATECSWPFVSRWSHLGCSWPFASAGAQVRGDVRVSVFALPDLLAERQKRVKKGVGASTL